MNKKYATLLQGQPPGTTKEQKDLVVTDRYVIAWPTPDISAKTIAAQFYQKLLHTRAFYYT